MQQRLDERRKIVRKLASMMPEKKGYNLTESQKINEVRLQLAALEAQNLIKTYLPYLSKI